MYGAGVLQREHWPLWMLVAAVLSGLMALTSGGRVSSSSGLKLVSRVPEAGADATHRGGRSTGCFGWQWCMRGPWRCLW